MSTSTPITVLVVDDHAVLRRGIAKVLAEDDRIDVVGEAGSGEEAIDKTGQLHPDVVLLDVRLPLMDGIVATREVRTAFPDTKVLVLSAFDDDQMTRAIDAGASGYLSKDEDLNAIVQAVTRVASGELYFGAMASSRVLARMRRPRYGRPSEYRTLTPREVEVLRLMIRGERNREIAARFGVSDRTVGNYLASIYSKLGVHGKAEAIVYAVRAGIVSA